MGLAQLDEGIGDEFTTKTFLTEFGALASESDAGFEHLRGLIIELAIRGRLGTQRTGDGSAEGLLRLAAKVLDVSRKQTRLDTPPSPTYTLPKGWVWCAPQDLGQIAPRNEVDDDATVGFIPMANVPTDYRKPVVPDSRRWKEIKKGYTHVADGDIAVAKITPCFQNRKSCVMHGLPNGLGAGTTELLVLRPVDGVVEPGYLLLFYKSPEFIAGGVGLMTGTAGQQRVPAEYFAAVPLPLPPLAEQKRIVAKVDQLMALCDDLEAWQAKKTKLGTQLTKSALEALTAAEGPEEFAAAWKTVVENFDLLIGKSEAVQKLRRVILELGVRGKLVKASASPIEVRVLAAQVARERFSMIEGRRKGGRGNSDSVKSEPFKPPYRVPDGWCWCVLADIAGHIVDGTHHTPQYVDSGMDFISAKDIRNGKIRFDGCRQISKIEFAELTRRCRPKRGDVLVTKSGSIGEVAIVNTGRDFTLFESVALVPVVRSVNSTYVGYVVYLGASGAFGLEKQRGVAVRHLHLVDLRKLPFPLPPRKEQDAIVAKVEELMEICDDLQSKLARSEDRAAKLVEAVVQELVA